VQAFAQVSGQLWPLVHRRLQKTQLGFQEHHIVFEQLRKFYQLPAQVWPVFAQWS
jgi:hypothetical protein